MIETETIKAVVRDVWAAGLGIDLDDPTGDVVAFAHTDVLRATVAIDGDWVGEVHVTCPRDVAAVAAGVLFRAEANSMDDDDVLDALGEVANMTGGGLKALLPGECQLHPPRVARTDDPSIEQEAVDSAVLVFGSLPVVISLTSV